MEKPRQHWFVKLLENLRSQLTWMDSAVGLCAITAISIVLTGFRYQAIPEYKTGQIANEDIRAIQDLVFEDAAATGQKRAEAEAGVPALYQLDSDLIANRERAIGRAFSEARDVLAEEQITSKAKLTPSIERDLLQKLEARVGETFPASVLPVLLRHFFDPVLESRILKLLDAVLQAGIIADRGQFLKDQRTGIVVRDGSFPFEHPLADASLARDLSGAREYLHQFHPELAALSQQDRAMLIRYLESVLVPTFLCDQNETEARRVQAASRVQPVIMRIKRGQTIVRSGERVTASMIAQLNALKNLQGSRSLIRQFGGYFFLAAVLIYSLWRYFVSHQARHRKIRNHTALILVIIVCGLLVMRIETALADILSERFEFFRDTNVLYYGVPFAFVALLATLLIDVNLGIISSVLFAVLAGLFYGDIDLAVYILIGSMAGIYSIRQYKDRAAILKAGLTIAVVNIFCMAGLDILRQIPMTLSRALDQFVLALVSGILASAVASIFLPALETLFKIATDIRLLELSNLNAPLLRRLSVEAPGTYHHSLMVATLAEAASESIGANPLLARVGAYYHDLGKMLRPEYFVENQSYGSNKHEDLSPSMSCLILSSHVKNGLQLANEIGLPQRISDMIPQHHGTRMMTYFYEKAKDSIDAGNNEIVESAFRYPGPKPQSKEAAIMMMADSVEAASRTLSDPSPAQIQGMINRLVDAIVSDNQFVECDITLRDIYLVKESFLKILSGIFHHRIDYPGYDFKSIGDESERAAVQNPGTEQAKTVSD